MSFYSTLEKYRTFDFSAYRKSIKPDDIAKILQKEQLEPCDYLSLISDAADGFLEQMAQKAHTISHRHFGNVVVLFSPLYISNFCENRCQYCSFSSTHSIVRTHLNFDEIDKEAQTIAAAGIRHILLLTGDAPKRATIDYLKRAVQIASDHFSSVALEVYALTQKGYGQLIEAGVDALTMYQETYDQAAYAKLHTGGPKADYHFRLNAHERACKENIHAVTVGALLGLADPWQDTFFAGLHAQYLQQHFPGTEVSISFPRIRPLVGEFNAHTVVYDREYVRILTATRLFLPTAGISLTTRESTAFRNAVLPMGITRMSAGVSTAVGGHSHEGETPQFEIADDRSAVQMQEDLKRLGYQAVMHDWSGRFFVPCKL